MGEFETRMAELEDRNAAESERIAALKRQVEESQAVAFVDQQNSLRETISAQIESLQFFTKPGPYDTLVDRDEITFDSDHRAFRSSRGRYMAEIEKINTNAAPETLAALEAIKRRFYDKLNHRMEEFFRAGPESHAG